MPKATNISMIATADLDDAARLVTELRTDMNGRVVCSVNEMRSVLNMALREPTYTGFLARTHDGDAVAFLGMNQRFAIYAGGRFFQITELYVAPSARRLGVASALILSGEAHALANGGRCIELGAPSQESHPHTHAFYAAQGYRIVGPRLSKTLPLAS